MNAKTILSATIALLLGASVSRAADQTATWNNTTGSWSNAARWSTNPLFPNNGNGGFTFDAIVNGGSVAVDTAITIEKLTLGGGSIEGTNTLTLNQLSTFTDGGKSDAGIINANGGMTFSGAGNKFLSGGAINLGGASTWTGGTFLFGVATLATTAGSSLTTNFDGSMGSFSGPLAVFNNAGTFTKSAGAGATIFETSVNNTGTINVNSGTLQLHGGGTSTGLFNAAAGTTLRFSGGTHNVNSGGSVAAAVGTVRFSGGTTNFNAGSSYTAGSTDVSGTVNFNAAASTGTLTLSAGDVGGTGTLTISGASVLSGGGMSGAGTTNANGGVTLSGTVFLGRALNLSSTSTWTAGGIIFSGGGTTLTNTTGSSLTTNFDGAMSVSGSNVFYNNAGTFTKSAGAGTTTIGSGGFSGITFNNTGTVNADSGTLSFIGAINQYVGTTLTGGTWNVRNGATLDFSSGSNITTNQGTVLLDGAGSTFARFTTALNNNQGSFTLKNNRDLTTAGALANSGSVTVEDAGTTLTVSGNYTQSAGTALLRSGGQLAATSTIINGGVVELAAGGSLSTPSVAVNNGGTLLVSGGGADQITNAAGVTLNGNGIGTAADIVLGGTSAIDETVGALTLSSNSSIDFGTLAGGHTLRFADSSALSGVWSGTLSIYNWSGLPYIGGGPDHLFFGINASGLTGSQLDQIIFYDGGSGSAVLGTGGILPSGEVVPVPEPSSVLAGLTLLGLTGWRGRRRAH